MEKWTTSLEEITNQVKKEFSLLTENQLNYKPNSVSWSIAQNLEHLIVVNEIYFPIITSIKTGTYKTPFISKIGFMVSFFEKTVLNAVRPDRKKKMKTFPVWEPTTSNVISDILNRFQIHQIELIQKIEGAKELVEKGIVISSPANKNIVYKLEIAFDIIVSHEQRHLEQAKEILQLMKINTSH